MSRILNRPITQGYVMDKLNGNQIIEIVQGALGLEGESITLESSHENIEEWDSLGQLSILTALDEALDGKVGDIVEMATASSIELIIETLKDHSLIEDLVEL